MFDFVLLRHTAVWTNTRAQGRAEVSTMYIVHGRRRRPPSTADSSTIVRPFGH